MFHSSLARLSPYITYVAANYDSKNGEEKVFLFIFPFPYLFLSEFVTLFTCFPYKLSTPHSGSKAILERWVSEMGELTTLRVS